MCGLQPIATAERLFRIRGYTATGLTQILEESGAPKGSFYFHFPRGKAQLAGEAIDNYVTNRIAILRNISANTTGEALNFVHQIFSAFAAEMAATDFQNGGLMQNLANELPAPDADLTKRVARGFADSTEIIAEHSRGCGFVSARASSSAAALVAALEGARTIARLERWQIAAKDGPLLRNDPVPAVLADQWRRTKQNGRCCDISSVTSRRKTDPAPIGGCRGTAAASTCHANFRCQPRADLRCPPANVRFC